MTQEGYKNRTPETFAELRQMIRDAEEIYATAIFNEGKWEDSAGTLSSTEVDVPVTKQFAYELYRGLSGEYWPNVNTAYWYENAKQLWIC